MALSTAQDMVDSSLRLLGVVDQEGTPTTAQRNQGLDALNALLDSLNVDGTLVVREDDEQVTIAAASTTWGAGGTITTTRPIKLIAARRVDSGTLEPEVTVLQISEYRERYDKGVSGNLITHVAYDPSLPLGVLYVLGSSSGTLKLTTLKPLTQYTTLGTSLGLGPGYVRFFKHALAVELAPEYPGVQPSQISVSIMSEMRRQIGARNAGNLMRRMDNDLSEISLYR